MMVRRAPQRDGVRLRKLAADPRLEIMPTAKAAARLHEAGISLPDIQFSLANCTVVQSEQRHGQWRRTVRGCDVEGCQIKLVITIDPSSSKRIVVLAGERLE